MCRLPVNVQLIVLIVVDETPPLLKYREVGVVALRQQIQIIAVRELSAHLHRLSIRGVELPQRVNIRPVALLAAFPEPDLGFAHIALQVIVYDVEVLERGEFRIWKEGRLDKELALLGVDVEPVPSVDADLLAHAGDEPVHLLVEVCGVVDDVEVRVADPRSCGVIVELPR